MKFNFFKKENLDFAKNEKPKIEVKKDSKSIMGCIIDSKNVDEISREMIEKIIEDGVFVDYYAEEKIYQENNMKNAGRKTYAISACDEKDKWSTRYYNCTGVIMIGEEKETGKQVSFMSHQDPDRFLGSKKQKFAEDLEERIREFKSRVKEGTIDAILFGGNAGDYQYQESIKFLGDVVKTQLNFEPRVQTGPNSDWYSENGATDIYLDTQNRRLYIVRVFQENDKFNRDYLPSELREKSEEWFN